MIVVDGSGGRRQVYIEDCEVCCRPNRLVISIAENLRSAEIQAEMS